MQTNRKTVLVVEDDVAVRKFSLVTLRNHGYRTLEAHDGDSGFTVFLRHKDDIDVILTDIVMPAVTGPEMIEKIAKVEPSVKIVFMTGTPDHPDLPRLAGKRYELLVKPFTPDQLATVVQNCLESCA